MKDSIKTAVAQVLTSYLETNNLRKTPERYAVLDAAYSFGGHFTLDELGEKLLSDYFRVSRGTLYNTLNLLITLRLVIKHRLQGVTKYEACYQSSSHCHQICTVCGKVTEVKSPEINAAVEQTHLRRFHRDVFSLYIYGICSTCQARQTRKQRLTKKQKTKQ
jgi:Fur family ferric uptake transcriptional regulator